jgi:hypothetical protein
MRTAVPPLARRERPLTRERDLSGDPVVGTDRAVYHRCAAAPAAAAWQRLGWEEIDQVRWERQAGLLTLASPLPGRAPGLALRLPAGARLVALAGERVTATTLACARVRLGGEATAWVSARCRPGAGEVTWVVTVNGGCDPEDLDTQALLLAAIHQLRVQMGI